MTPSLCQPVKFICVFCLHFIFNAWRQLEIDFTEKWQAELIDNMWNQENIHIYKNTQVIYVFGSLNTYFDGDLLRIQNQTQFSKHLQPGLPLLHILPQLHDNKW